MSDPVRVLFFRPTLGQGGADRVTATLLQHLERPRFRPSLALLRKEGELLATLPKDVSVVSLEADRLRWARRPLTQLLTSDPPDVVFSTSSSGNVIATLAAKDARFSGRLVLSERSSLIRERSHWKNWGLLMVKRHLYPHADLVTAVSEGVRQDLLKRLKLPPDSVRTVYNPVVTPELDELAAEPLPAEERQDGPLLVAAGRLEAVKDFSGLLEALVMVREQVPARLVLLGEGPARAELERRARELNLAHVVDMPGFLPNPMQWFARCDVFVLSSRYEGFPGVLIQAMACGAAVVSTDCPFGPSEIIEPGENGLLVPVGDPPALATAILWLLNHQNRRLAMASAARLSAQRFTLDRVLPLYEAALSPSADAP